MVEKTIPPSPTQSIVTVQFRVALTRGEVEKAFLPDAPRVAALPGLVWKVWSLDEETRSFAGVYLFGDHEAAQAFIAGPVVAALRREPHFSEVRAQAYGVLEGLSRITRAPIANAGAASVAKSQGGRSA
jgi:hypothetical protein